jgi:lysophospholipase L1-like esterase
LFFLNLSPPESSPMQKFFRAAILSILACLAIPAFATTPLNQVQFYANHLQDATLTVIANATLHVNPVNNSGAPISFEAGGGGQVSSEGVSTLVTNGVFTINLADSALAIDPINPCYAITVTSNVNGKQLLAPFYQCVQPAGSGLAVTGPFAWCTAATLSAGGSCDFDNYNPRIPANLVSSPAGPAGANGTNGTNGTNGINGSATVAIGTVSTGPLAVTNVGTSTAAILDFTIPASATGNPATAHYIFTGDSRMIVTGNSTVSCESDGDLEMSISSYSITSNMLSLVYSSSVIPGNSDAIVLSGFPTSTFLNGQTIVILPTATSTTATAAFVHANVSSTTEAGTGGCSYNLPRAAGKLPALNGHGSVINAGIGGGSSASLVSAYAASVHPFTTAVTGAPSFVFITLSVNDFNSTSCPTNASLQANYQSLMASAHTDGATVVFMTAPQGNWNITTQCATAYSQWQQMTQWARAQGKAQTTLGTGQYWDYIVDAAQVFTNPGSALYYTDNEHLSDAGNALWASMVNAAIFTNSSVAETVPQCGPNMDVACVNEANTFIGGGTFKGGITIEDSPGGTSNQFVFNPSYSTVPYVVITDGTFGGNFLSYHENGTLANLTLPGFAGWCFNGSTSFAGSSSVGAPDTCLARDQTYAKQVDIGGFSGLSDQSGGAGFTYWFGPATAPTGSCPVNGRWEMTQDGAITHCVSGTWTAFSGGAVSSVFGRTGAVVATSGDYTVAQVSGAAPLASPALTGTPTAPTQICSSNTDIATGAYVAACGSGGSSTPFTQTDVTGSRALGTNYTAGTVPLTVEATLSTETTGACAGANEYITASVGATSGTMIPVQANGIWNQCQGYAGVTFDVPAGYVYAVAFTQQSGGPATATLAKWVEVTGGGAGPAGAAGATGSTGATGPAGPTGPSGGGASFPFAVIQQSSQTNANSGTACLVQFGQATASSGNTAFIMIGTDAGVTVTIPSGWTQDLNITSSTNVRFILAHKTTAAESSASFAYSGTASCEFYMFELVGARSLDVSANNVTTGTPGTVTPSAITPTSGDMVVAAVAFYPANSPSGSAKTFIDPFNSSWVPFGYPNVQSSNARSLSGAIYAGAASGSSMTPPPLSQENFTAGGLTNPVVVTFAIK